MRRWLPSASGAIGARSRASIFAPGFASPDVDEYLEGEGVKYALRLPASRVLQETDRLPPQAPCRPPVP
jgi:hypothetical protein